MGELEGRVALVTGSTRGIGAAVAERFAAEGATVVVRRRGGRRGGAPDRRTRRCGGPGAGRPHRPGAGRRAAGRRRRGRRLARSHPLQRLGTPEDVADAALFLVSDRSAWLSGITLDVAGGSVLA